VARFTRTRSSLALRAVVLLLLGSLAAACGGGSSGSGGSSSDKVTLRVAWWGSDSRHTYTKKIIELYQQEHPNVTIQPDYTSFDNYWNKLATAVAAGKGPDVMQQDVRYVREYANRGALADLTPFLGKQIRNADFDPAVNATGTIDGKNYAIPTGINAFAIVANPAVFAKAGVPLPDDTTWTWDDLAKVAAQVTAKSPKGTYGLQDLGYVDVTLDIWTRQHGETLFDDKGKIAVTKPTLTAWYAYVQQLRATAAEPPASLSVEVQHGGVDQSLTATGKGGLGGWWTNQLPALTKAAGTPLKLLRMPGDSTRPGTYFKPAMFWSMSANSSHRDAAAAFIDFLMNDPRVATMTLSDRGLPTNLKLRAAITPQLKEADKLGLAFIDRIKPTIGTQPPLQPKGMGKVVTDMAKINEQVLFGKQTPEQAADAFLQQARTDLGA